MDERVAIVDYGVGNIFNIQRAFDSAGAKTFITGDRKKILEAPRLLLPGVGAFEAGMRHLDESGLTDVVREFARTGKPVLGICLGMQLLMTRSHENGVREGLGLIGGEVLPLKITGSLKVPQIGWNSLRAPNGANGGGDPWRGTLLSGIDVSSEMYFIHSYYAAPEVPSERVAMTEYGDNLFCSVVKKGNITGCQFHPERSSEWGLKLLKNFAFDEVN